MKRRLLPESFIAAMYIVLVATPACSADTQNSHEVKLPPANKATLRALLKKTQKQLVYVGGGQFTMGEEKSTKTYEDGHKLTGYYTCGPLNGATETHPVRLDSYSISAYETTYGEQDTWAAFTDSKPVLQIFSGKEKRSDDRPAGTRTWHEAKNYCGWLGKVTGLPFDLPTEAQWEYAARSRGKKVPFATANGRWKTPETYENGKWRDDPQFLGARHESSPEYPPPTTPLPVGTYPPNRLGLYDMTGNAWEWVNDWYAKNYYMKSPEDNPQGPKNGKKKILRGGSFNNSAHCNTVYNRYPQKPADDTSKLPMDVAKYGFNDHGFRCAVNIDHKLKSGELIQRAKKRGYLE